MPGHAIANEAAPSPISFILKEAGISESADIKKGKRAYTPHFGYESLTLPTKHGSKMKLHGKNVKKSKNIDNLHLDLGNNKDRCEELEKKLTAKYGEPKSQRNNIRIWELKNPDLTAGQSRNITIMAGEEKGQYFVTLDRKGPRVGNNPHTNASLRKTNLNQSKSVNASQAAPQVNRNIRD